MSLSTATAAQWVERWERQQQRYAIDREERLTVVADVVEHVTADAPHPHVVDLGCGPGSLAIRLAARLPRAHITAVDMDPLLLELGRALEPARPAGHGTVRYVEATIGGEGWTAALGLDAPLDAAVSTTALHYLPDSVLQRVYVQLASLLRPGGVLVNADHLHQESAADIAAHVGHRRADRQGAYAHEDWEEWWAAAACDPDLSHLFALRREREAAGGSTGGTNHLTQERHTVLLRQAGFSQVASVWQVGNSCVLVAVR